MSPGIISYDRCIICDSPTLYHFRKIGRFELVRCKQCRLIFCNNVYLEEIRKFYSEGYFEKSKNSTEDDFSSYEDLDFVIRHYAGVILNQIEKYIKEPGRILDIGAGFGYFLNEARQKGWEVFGVELSNIGLSYAKKNFKLPLQAALFEYEDLEIDSLQFDVIVFLGVLDHSTAPHKMLAKAYSLLKPDGIVVSTAQNIDWWLKIIDFRPPTHLFYFSQKNISQLYQKLGFRILVNRPFWVPFSVDEFVRRILRYYIRFPKLIPYICSALRTMFKESIIKWPNENLIIAQKVTPKTK